jgi:hypothetical protein
MFMMNEILPLWGNRMSYKQSKAFYIEKELSTD